MGPQLPGPSVQQYSLVLKTVQGLLHPPGARNSVGHSSFMAAAHRNDLQTPVVGLKSMGILNPSTRDMSTKSKLVGWSWFSANSARVFGGLP